MNALTIRQKIFFVFIMLIIAFVVNGVYSAYSLSSINDGALRISFSRYTAPEEVDALCDALYDAQKSLFPSLG